MATSNRIYPMAEIVKKIVVVRLENQAEAQ